MDREAESQPTGTPAPSRPVEARDLGSAVLPLASADAGVRESFESAGDPLHAAFMAMHEGVIVQDRQGRIIAGNPAAANILGLSAEELLGHTLRDPQWNAVHEDGSPFQSENHPALMALQSGKAQRDIVMGIPNASGAMTWILVQADPVFAPGESAPKAVVCSFDDITQARNSREALERAKQEAEESSRIKDKFVSLLAHDLRAPIATAMTMIDLVTQDEAEKLSVENHDALKTVQERLRQQLDLIDGVLSITRLRTGKLRAHRRKVPAGTVLAAGLGLKRQAELKKIQLLNEVEFGQELFVDPILFGQVLQNLVSNAIKFTPSGGTIRIFVPPDRPSSIAVQDSGVGIDTDRMSDLFRTDVKTSTVGTAGERGTGMGLPLSHDIMVAHGGTLQIESERGKGTTFYADLPAYRPVVLVVDDEVDLRMLIKRYLMRQGCEVVEAGNGEEALNLLKTVYANLIITDVQMPRLDGFGLLDAIRRNPEIADTPVIVVTVGTDVETRDKAFALGANDFVTKPITPHDFLPRVRRFLV